jgi:hypothetical protein
MPNVFVETGTYMGDTISNMLNHFSKLYSIELSSKYASEAVDKFKNNTNVRIIQGDSSKVLKVLVRDVNDTVFFWLDGHWSGGNTARGSLDCPLLEELHIISNDFKNECIVAIDDVRLFGTNISEDWSDITKEGILKIVKNRLVSCEYFPSSCAQDDRMILHLKAL